MALTHLVNFMHIKNNKLKKWGIISIGICNCCIGLTFAQSKLSAAHIDSLKNYLHNPRNADMLVAAHRGDWRNAPENSIQALKNCIEMGVDIMEIDLKRTKDGHLILMHDHTIDRTTNGKGEPKDFTLEELKLLRLKNGLGRTTTHQIPTFKEFLQEAKDKILIDVDKGYSFLKQVIKELQETQTLTQTIINIDDNTSYEEVVKRFGEIPEEAVLMPIISYNSKSNKTNEVVNSYLKSGRKFIILQPVWANDAQIKDIDFHHWTKSNYGVWINSLWPSLCGGHDDDKAVELRMEKETWGWIKKRGASVIQTDRPKEALGYFRMALPKKDYSKGNDTF